MQDQSQRRIRVTTQRLTDAACRLANRVGFQAISMNELAAELGIRAPSLYTHVSGIEEVRRLIALRGLDELYSHLDLALSGPEGQMQALFDAYRRFALNNPGVYIAILPTPAASDIAWTSALERLRDRLLLTLAPFNLDRREAIHALRAMRSLAHGFVSLELSGALKNTIGNDESYRWLVTCYLDGLSKKASALGRKQNW